MNAGLGHVNVAHDGYALAMKAKGAKVLIYRYPRGRLE